MSTFRIAEISFGRSHWDDSFEYEFGGHKFEVQRFGANFSVDLFKKLIQDLRTDVDAFALSGLPPVIKLDEKTYVHRQYLEIMNTPTSVPLCDGTGLREISNINSLIKLIESGKISPEQGIFFPAAILSTELEEFLRSRYPGKVFLGDAYAMLGMPMMVKASTPGMMTLSKLVLNVANLKDLRNNTPSAETGLKRISRSVLASQVEKVQYVCSDFPFFLLFDSSAEFVRGKDLIVWSHHPAAEREALKYGPRSVINLFPEEFKFSPYMNYSILDATLRLAHGKTAPLNIEEWEQLIAPDSDLRQISRQYVVSHRSSTQLKISKGLNKIKNNLTAKSEPDFAFIIHALSHNDLLRAPGLGVLKHMPKKFNDPFDRLISKAPPIVYGDIRHIISKDTGREVNGIIYGMFSTPKVLKEEDPEVTYAKIERICYDAANRGAKIIGLGAYTKVVGDSGVTINKNSPIPVTTGNSLSASSTLWALAEVVRKMRLLKVNLDSGKVDGMAMVIGATGSIGKVSAKLLALTFSKVCLVAPRQNRLDELAAEIRLIAPECQIQTATDANELAGVADVLVTATSAFDQKIIDVERLKPGCVVCDCSRPLDFDEEDAKKRPDVLIIESGEVVLPGPVDMNCSLGLPGKAVYACLAETALLSLEGRNESFTMGRDIEWNKVKQIYKMARKHGVELAAIQGHMGIVSDREIELTRSLALSRLKKT